MIGYAKGRLFSIVEKTIKHLYERHSVMDKNLEYEFLPASQEVTETPASPLGRATIWIIFFFLTFVLVWSYLGKIDKVANGMGKIIPKGKLKVIKPMDGGVITAIHVHEGQRVKKGQLLLELDNTIRKADLDVLKKRLATSKIEKQYLIQELDKNGDTDSSTYEFKDIISSSQMLDFQKRLTAERTVEFNEKIQAASLVIDRNKKEFEMSLKTLESLKNKISLLTLEEEIERKSFKNGFSSEIEWRTKRNELESNKQELETQKINIERLKNNIKESQKNLQILKKEQSTFLLEKIVDKDKEINSLEAELTKSEKMFEYQKLSSPVDGIIHGLSTYTLGGVVDHSEAIITIVPENTPLVAEVLVLNRDIGFIKKGQDVELKLETFPFQDYGTIKGKILSISPDSIEDENKKLLYKADVSLDKNYLLVDGERKNVFPGMKLVAEIKIGKRRIIDFFLSPFKKSVKEALIIR